MALVPWSPTPYDRAMSISAKEFYRQVSTGIIAMFALSFAQAQVPGRADDAQTRLRELIDGYRATQMLHVAAKLRIADHLQQGPLSVKELAKRTSTHEDSLYRLLRTLADWASLPKRKVGSSGLRQWRSC